MNLGNLCKAIGIALLVVGCAQERSSLPSAVSVPPQLQPIIVDLEDAGDWTRIEVVNIRMQPAARRSYTLRVKQEFYFERQRLALDTTYKGFTTITSREDGRTSFRAYIEQIDGSVLDPDGKGVLPISTRESPFMLLETLHNTDNSIHSIELPYLVDVARDPSQRKQVRFFALNSLMDSLGWLVPVRTSRLQLGQSIWPASMSELSELWDTEFVPALIRSATLRQVYDLTPPAERGKFRNYEESARAAASSLAKFFASMSRDGSSMFIPVVGFAIWEGQDVVRARGQFRFQGAFAAGEDEGRMTMSGTLDVLIDPYSSQSVRSEFAAAAEFVAAKGRFLFQQNISATASPAPNARRVVSPPTGIGVVPPTAPSAQGRGESKDSQDAARTYGDLPPGGTAMRISDIYRDSVDAIFTIAVGDSQGSGFAVSPTHVLTNRHVVEDARSKSIQLMQKGVLVATARVERVFEGEIDLAVLRLDKPLPLRPLKLTEELPQIGTEILVIGSPIGLEGSITGGLVSQIRMLGGVGYLQIDTSINPGNSGSPVLDRLGRVVGIATSRLIRQNQISGIGFALGSETVRRAIGGSIRISLGWEPLFIGLSHGAPELLSLGGDASKLLEHAFMAASPAGFAVPPF